MRVLIWIVEGNWEASIDAIQPLLPADAEVTLLYVVPADLVETPRAALGGLLGRQRPAQRDPSARIAALSERAAGELLAAARERLGRQARQELRRGRVEQEVLAASADVDLLVVARDEPRAGPHSLAPPTRFVLDHATCALLLVSPWTPAHAR